MSRINANTIADQAGTGPTTLTGQSAVRAWTNWNMSGRATINESLNVSSLTDNGRGNVTFNLTNNMATSTYGCMAQATRSVGATDYSCASETLGRSSVAAGSCRIITTFHNFRVNGLHDTPDSTCGFLGELA